MDFLCIYGMTFVFLKNEENLIFSFVIGLLLLCKLTGEVQLISKLLLRNIFILKLYCCTGYFWTLKPSFNPLIFKLDNRERSLKIKLKSSFIKTKIILLNKHDFNPLIFIRHNVTTFLHKYSLHIVKKFENWCRIIIDNACERKGSWAVTGGLMRARMGGHWWSYENQRVKTVPVISK